MLYLLGRIALFEQVTARLAELLALIDRSIQPPGGSTHHDADVMARARSCYVRTEATATLTELRVAVIDAIFDLAHQLGSLEEDIRYERRRLPDDELLELRESYWKGRKAIQHLLDAIATQGHRRVPKLNPDPFDERLDLGLF